MQKKNRFKVTEEMIQKIELSLQSQWSNVPATEKQKWLLGELGISFNPRASKGDAFLLISKRLNRPKQMEKK